MSNQMQIEVVNVNPSTVPTAKGSYQMLDVAYKNKSFQDKLEGKKVMSFGNKDVFAALAKAQFGDVFTVQREKNDKGFWDWIRISSGDMADSAVGTPAANDNIAVAPVMKGNPAPKSNYETAEERAARQVLIVRQSSISSAVDLAVANKIKDPQEVITIAKTFEQYVFGTEPVNGVATEAPPTSGNFFEDMEDDLP